MVAVLALTGAALVIVAGLGTAARIVHIGNLDALALAEKLARPYPRSAVEWPELVIRAVIPQPGESPLVLLVVANPRQDWPAATLLVHLRGRSERSVRLLSEWCRAAAPISPTGSRDAEFELRRRQSLDRVLGLLLAEDTGSGAGSARPRPLSA